MPKKYKIPDLAKQDLTAPPNSENSQQRVYYNHDEGTVTVQITSSDGSINVPQDVTTYVMYKHQYESVWQSPVFVGDDGVIKNKVSIPTEPKEQYWSGGTDPNTGGNHSVDVFLNKDEFQIGVAGDTSHTLIEVSRDDVVKLIKMLNEGLAKADEWTRWNKYLESTQAKEENNLDEANPPHIDNEIY